MAVTVHKPMPGRLEAINTLLYFNHQKHSIDGKLHGNFLPQYIRQRMGKK